MSNLLHLEGRFQFFQQRGPWFWGLILAGSLFRLFLVLFTEGTYDVLLWKSHAQGVLDHGLVQQYRASEALNHPPLACLVASAMLLVSQKTGIAFATIMRAPLTAVDLGTAFLLGYVLRNTRYRWVATGCYAIYPLAIVLSAYHGNTDCLIAFLLLLSVALSSVQNPAYAAIALGVSFWIKLPGLMAAPALTLGFRQWRHRFLFAFVAVASGVLTYIPMLLIDPQILFTRVFNYPGQIIQTTAGIPVWGLQNFLYLLDVLPSVWKFGIGSVIIWIFDHNRLVILALIVALAWMRRGRQTSSELGWTLAGCYSILYAVSNSWSFQYFAWSIPFWFLAGRPFLAGATLLPASFICLLYGFLCGNPFLMGPWDFVGHPLWPPYLLALRNLAVLFFVLASLFFLGSGINTEMRRFRTRLAHTEGSERMGSSATP